MNFQKSLLILGILVMGACDAGSKASPTAEEAPKSVTVNAEAVPQKIQLAVDIPKTDGASVREPTALAEDTVDPFTPPKSVAAPPTDAGVTKSGLHYKIIKPATEGSSPELKNIITAHYTGWQTDGKMFDSSHKRKRPFTSKLGNLIKGWQEGIGMMKRGEKRRFWIPAELAYKGNPNAPQGMLVFDVELIDFK